MNQSCLQCRKPWWLSGVLICLAVLAPLLSTHANTFAQEASSAATSDARKIDLSVQAHDIFLDPPVLIKGQQVTVGANIQLRGTKADLEALLTDLGLSDLKVRIEATPGLAPIDFSVTANSFNQDFGQAVILTTWDIPANTALNPATIKVTIDPNNEVGERKENNNTAKRVRHLRDASRRQETGNIATHTLL